MYSQREIDEMAPVYGEYGMYGQYVYPEEYLPADEDYLDEQWAPIDSSNTDYWVSTHGRIWSGKSQRFMKPKNMDDHGHLGIAAFNKEGKTKYLYTHRLMAQAFIPNPNHYPVVRHLDDDPTSNFLYNLAWGTQKDNARDCIENGHAYFLTDADRRKGNLDRMVPIIATNMSTNEERWYESMNEASRDLEIPHANIWKVIKGQRRQAGGYYFRKGERRDE